MEEGIYMYHPIRDNPLHTVIAFTMIGIGLFLMVSDHYFTWPPVVAEIANDDAVGMMYVVIGVVMAIWVLDPKRSVRMDHIILTVATFAMATLSFYQLLHSMVMGSGMPWISNAALTIVIMIIARRSDSV
ncbi:hypothetical protein [Levilactobacillus brevis]|uniref:hypothetical protein n=1 Tax=Levilactobacillus brevis TaxID=1580 RepID=UPI0020739D0B|nr:hypothetical protein [Levilactobacillus brevis]